MTLLWPSNCHGRLLRLSHQAPEYNIPLRMFETSRSVCHGDSKYDFVIVVKNAVLGFDARAAFRRHMRDQRRRYPRLNVGYVFSLGVPRTHGGRYFNRHGMNLRFDGKSGDLLEAFDGKADEAMARVREEIDKHDDIVLGDFEDTYYNLTWKDIMNYR